METHNKEKDESGLTFVERDFKRRVNLEKVKRFTRVDQDCETVYLFLGDEAGYIKCWDLSVLLD